MFLGTIRASPKTLAFALVPAFWCPCSWTPAHPVQEVFAPHPNSNLGVRLGACSWVHHVLGHQLLPYSVRLLRWSSSSQSSWTNVVASSTESWLRVWYLHGRLLRIFGHGCQHRWSLLWFAPWFWAPALRTCSCPHARTPDVLLGRNSLHVLVECAALRRGGARMRLLSTKPLICAWVNVAMFLSSRSASAPFIR